MSEKGTEGTKRTRGTVGREDPPESSSSPKSLETGEGFIPPHGGYEQLFSFQKARIVYVTAPCVSVTASWTRAPAPMTR